MPEMIISACLIRGLDMTHPLRTRLYLVLSEKAIGEHGIPTIAISVMAHNERLLC
jgi:hypothetical protein